MKKPGTKQSAFGKKELIQWGAAIGKQYSIKVGNVTSDWKDGCLLCAIADFYEPGALRRRTGTSFQDMDLRMENRERNISLVFDLFYDLHAVERYLDPEDFGLEALSMMTYLFGLYKALHKPQYRARNWELGLPPASTSATDGGGISRSATMPAGSMLGRENNTGAMGSGSMADLLAHGEALAKRRREKRHPKQEEEEEDKGASAAALQPPATRTAHAEESGRDTQEQQGHPSEDRPKLEMASRAKRPARSSSAANTAASRGSTANRDILHKIASMEDAGAKERAVDADAPAEVVSQPTGGLGEPGDDVKSNNHDNKEKTHSSNLSKTLPARRKLPPGAVGFGFDMKDVLAQRSKLASSGKKQGQATEIATTTSPSPEKRQQQQYDINTSSSKLKAFLAKQREHEAHQEDSPVLPPPRKEHVLTNDDTATSGELESMRTEINSLKRKLDEQHSAHESAIKNQRADHDEELQTKKSEHETTRKRLERQWQDEKEGMQQLISQLNQQMNEGNDRYARLADQEKSSMDEQREKLEQLKLELSRTIEANELSTSELRSQHEFMVEQLKRDAHEKLSARETELKDQIAHLRQTISEQERKFNGRQLSEKETTTREEQLTLEIAELKSQLQQSQEQHLQERQTLHGQLEDRNRELSEKAKEVQTHKERIHEASITLKRRDDEFSDLIQKREQEWKLERESLTKKQDSDSDSAVRQLEQSLHDREKQLELQKTTLNEWQSKYDELETRFKTLDSEHQTSLKQLLITTDEKDHLLDRVRSLEQDMTQQLQDNNRKLRNLEKQTIERAQQTQEEHHEQLTKMRKDHEEQMQELKENFVDKCNTLETQYKEKWENRQKEAMRESEDDMDNAKFDLQMQFEGKQMELQQQISTLEQEKMKMEVEMQTKSHTVDHLHKDLLQRDASIAHLKEELAEREQKVNDGHDVVNQKVYELESRLRSHESREKELKESIDEAREERDLWKQKLEEQEHSSKSNIDALKRQIRDLTAKLAVEEQKIYNYEDKIRQMEREISNSSSAQETALLEQKVTQLLEEVETKTRLYYHYAFLNLKLQMGGTVNFSITDLVDQAVEERVQEQEIVDWLMGEVGLAPKKPRMTMSTREQQVEKPPSSTSASFTSGANSNSAQSSDGASKTETPTAKENGSSGKERSMEAEIVASPDVTAATTTTSTTTAAATATTTTTRATTKASSAAVSPSSTPSTSKSKSSQRRPLFGAGDPFGDNDLFGSTAASSKDASDIFSENDGGIFSVGAPKTTKSKDRKRGGGGIFDF